MASSAYELDDGIGYFTNPFTGTSRMTVTPGMKRSPAGTSRRGHSEKTTEDPGVI